MLSVIILAIAKYALYLLMVILSILLLELLRDFFHMVSHCNIFKFLIRNHAKHHGITKFKAVDFRDLDKDKYYSSQWYWDLPEAFFMLLMSVIFSLIILSIF